MKYQLTILDGIGTRYNKKTEDWSGEEWVFSINDTTTFQTEKLTIDDIRKAIEKSMVLELDNYDINL